MEVGSGGGGIEAKGTGGSEHRDVFRGQDSAEGV